MGRLAERIFDWAYGVVPLDEGDPDVIFRLAPQRYRGPGFTMADGTQVRRGDSIVELHQDNQRLAAIHREAKDAARAGMAYYKLIRRSLGVLARAMESDPRLAGVVAAYGVNLFPGSTTRVGFEVRELTPRWRRRLLSWWIGRVVAKAHPQGRDRIILDGERRQVAEVWISRDTCIRLHGKGSRGG